MKFIFFILIVLTSFFFFQAEDGIRDHCVTGVQTCALPIYPSRGSGMPFPKTMAWSPRSFSGKAYHFREMDFASGDEACPAGWRSVRPASFVASRRRVTSSSGTEIGRAPCRESVWIRGVGAA